MRRCWGEIKPGNDIADDAVVDGDGGGVDDLDVGKVCAGEAGGQCAGDKVRGVYGVITEWLGCTISLRVLMVRGLAPGIRGSHTETCDQDCNLVLDAVCVEVPGAHGRIGSRELQLFA